MVNVTKEELLTLVTKARTLKAAITQQEESAKIITRLLNFQLDKESENPKADLIESRQRVQDAFAAYNDGLYIQDDGSVVDPRKELVVARKKVQDAFRSYCKGLPKNPCVCGMGRNCEEDKLLNEMVKI